MKIKLLIIASLILSSYSSMHGQGLNNGQYEFDETDAENIQEFFFGISTYKFYVGARTNEDYDIIVEEYKNKNLIDSTYKIKDIVKKFGHNPISSTSGDEFIRIYIKDNVKEKKDIELRFVYLNISLPHEFDELDLSVLQTRAFSDVPDRIEMKTPVLAIYGNKEKNFISCPGGAKPKDIVELYDWVAIIYLDRIKS